MPPPLRHRSMRIFVNDDRHVMAKHSAVYPTQEELEGVQNMVSHTERALKAVSDWLDEQEKGNAKANTTESEADTEPKSVEQPTRSLRGVMRVGLVAKGLLLKGDLDLELVLLCKDKPTITLLKKVAENLAVQLKLITDETYEVSPCIRDATIAIKNAKEHPLTLTIHLTSPLVREEAERLAAGDFYNNGGSNGGSVAPGPGAAGPGTNTSAGGAPGAGGFSSYYQSDGGYSSPTAAAKSVGRKPPMHPGTKVQGSGAGPGGSFGQYGQGFGQGKKSFGQTPGGGGGGNYSTAYPSQVTGGQDYNYEGYSNQSSYSSQGGTNQGFGGSSTPYHSGPVGYGRGDPSMNYQYR